MAPITDVSDISDDETAKRRQKSLDTILKQLSTNAYHDSVKSESTSSPFVKSHEGRSDTSTTKPEDEMDSSTHPVKRTRRIKKRKNFARPKLLPNETSSTDVSERDNFLLHFSDKTVRNHVPLSSDSRCVSVNDSDTTPPCKTDSKSIKGYDSIPGVDDITTESELIPIGDHAKGKNSEKNVQCSPTRVFPQKNLLSDKLKNCEKLEFLSGVKRKGRISPVKTLSDTKEKIQLFEECAEKENILYPPYNINENEKSTSDNSRFLNERDINSTFKTKGDSSCLHVRAIHQRNDDVSKSNNIRDIKIIQETDDERLSKHLARKSLNLHPSDNRLLITTDAETLTSRRSVPRLPKVEVGKEYNEKTPVTTNREESLDKPKSPQFQEKSRVSHHSQVRIVETKDAETLTPRRTGPRHLKGDKNFQDELSKIKQITPVVIGNAGDGLDEKTIPHSQKSRRTGSSENRPSEMRNSDPVTFRRSPKNLKKEGSVKGLKSSKNDFSKGTDFPEMCKIIENRMENITDQIMSESSPKSRRSLVTDDTPAETTYSNITSSVSKLLKEKETLHRFKDESPTNNYFQEIHQMNENVEKYGDVKSIPGLKQKTHRNISPNNTPSDTKVLSQGSLDYETYDRSVPKLLQRDESQGFRDECMKTKYFQETPHAIENVKKDSGDIIVPHSRRKSRRSTQQSENIILDLDDCALVNSKGSVDELSKEEDRKLNVYSTESKYFDAMSRVIERNIRGSIEEIKDTQLSWKFLGNHSSEDLIADFGDSEALSSGTSISRLLDELLENEQNKQHGPMFRVTDVTSGEFDEKLPQTSQKSDEKMTPQTPQKSHRHTLTDKRLIGIPDPELNATKTSVSKPIKDEGSRLSLKPVPSRTTQLSAECQVAGAKESFDEKNALRRKAWRTPSVDKKLLNIYGPENTTDRTRNFKEKDVCLGAKGDVPASSKVLEKPLDFEEFSPNKESFRVKTVRQSPKKAYTNQSSDNGIPDVTEPDRSSFSSSLRNLMKDSKSPHDVKDFVSKLKNYETSPFLESYPGTKSNERSSLKKSRKSELYDVKYWDITDSDTNAQRRSVRHLLTKDGDSIPSVREYILRSKSSGETGTIPDPSPIIGYVSDETLGLFPRKSRRDKLNDNRGSNETYNTKFRRSTPCLLKEGESHNNVKKYSPKNKNVHETPAIARVPSGKSVSKSSQMPRKNKRSENRTVMHRRSAPRLLKEGDNPQSFKEYVSKAKHVYETPSSAKPTSEGAEKKAGQSPKRTRRNKPFEMTESVPSSRKSIRNAGSRHSVKDFTSKSNNIHDFSIILQKSPVAEEQKEKSVRSVSRKSQRCKLPEKIILDTSDLNVTSLRKSIPCILIEGENRRSVKAYITKSKNVPEHNSSVVEPWPPEVEAPSEKPVRPSPRRTRRNRLSDNILIDYFSDTSPLRNPSSRLSRDVESRYSVKDCTSKTKAFHEILPVNQRVDGENVRSSRRKSRGNPRNVSLDIRHSDLNNMSTNRFRSIPRLTKEGKSSVKVESTKSRNLKDKNAKDEEIVLQSAQKSHKKLSHPDLQKRNVLETDTSAMGNKKKPYTTVLDILKCVLSNTSNVVQDDKDASFENKGEKNGRENQRKVTGKKQLGSMDCRMADGIDSHTSALRTSSRQSKEVERNRSVRDDVTKAKGVQDRSSVVEQMDVSVEKNSRRSRRKSQGGKRPTSSEDPFPDFNDLDFLKN